MAKQILGQNNTRLRRLIEQAKRLQRIDRELLNHIDPSLGKSCAVASFDQGCLKIATTTAGAATKLRYQFPELLKRLRQRPGFANLKRLDCVIVPDTCPGSPAPLQAHLSNQTASIIRDTASGIADTELQSALLRLAKNTHD